MFAWKTISESYRAYVPRIDCFNFHSSLFLLLSLLYGCHQVCSSLPPSLPPHKKKGCFLLSIDILIVCTSLYIYSQCFNICDSIFFVFLCFNYSKKQQHYVACLVMKSNYMLLTSLVCLAIYIMSTVSDNLGSLFFISRCLRPVCIFWVWLVAQCSLSSDST